MAITIALAIVSATALVFCVLWLRQRSLAHSVSRELQTLQAELLRLEDDLELLDRLSKSETLDVRLIASATRAFLLAHDEVRLATLGVTGVGLTKTLEKEGIARRILEGGDPQQTPSPEG